MLEEIRETVTVAKRLAEARRVAGLSREKAGELANCSAATIYHYEKGLRHPSSAILVRLARAYDRPMEWLMGESSTGIRETAGEYEVNRHIFPELVDLENALIQATDDQRAKLLGLVSGIASLIEGKD